MGKMDEDAVRRRLEQEAADEELAKKLDSDPDFAADFDKIEKKLLRDLEDGTLNKIAREKNMSDSEKAAMMRAAERARAAAKGGLFRSPDPAKAEKIIMSNRGLREARKHQQGKGCVVVALLFLGSSATAVGTLWAAAEVIVRALS
jgi:hypothetical protein